MVIDSSFPPLEANGFSIGREKCLLLNENNIEISLQGDCYHRKEWSNLISKFPGRLFFVAAGNENQNFDNPLYGADDLWSALSHLSNMVIVGSTTVEGFKYKSSNWGDRVDIMAQGEKINVISPLPLTKRGYPTTLRGTSFSTPQVVGKAIELWDKTKSLSTVKTELIEHFTKMRKNLVLKNYEKFCSSIESQGTLCLQSIVTLFRNDFIWGTFSSKFKQGKTAWNFSPFPIIFKKNLNSLAKVRLDKYEGKYIPHLYLRPSPNPYELLITLNHELFHYASYRQAAQYAHHNKKVKNCMTRYKIELLKDEKKAFLEEITFWKTSPQWFKNKFSATQFESKLLRGKYTYQQYYKKLRQSLEKDEYFISKRYIELGEYPKCALGLI